MTVWVLVMHLLMADGSVITATEDVQAATVEACLDVGRIKLEELHVRYTESTSGLHFCIKKEDG